MGLDSTLLATTPAVAENIRVDTPLPPPAWAVMQRELLRAQADACEEYFEQYFDERGYLRCVERWGADDGPDDAIECVGHWPVLYALGADAKLLDMYRRAWEGHLRQYTAARTVDVPFATDGMYYKEFPVMMDWLHNGEGLTAFVQSALADPELRAFQQRARRFADFYAGDEALVPNYDPQHQIIRSMFNGSRGPLLRKATAVDWAGDPLEIAGRFRPLHGETSYAEMLEHFVDYTDTVGDHPQNLVATTLAALAYMLDGDEKYRQWVLDYVDAWLERMKQNGSVIPSNIGLDGTIGGETDGKWYGGTYGWGFTVAVPGTNRFDNRNTVHWGLVGFVNAFMLSGDSKYLRGWAEMIDTINGAAREIEGQTKYPTMHGEQGWYGWSVSPWLHGAREICYLTWDAADRDRLGLPGSDWLASFANYDADDAATALAADFAAVRSRVESFRNDPTTPDTRLSDEPMIRNPATVATLCRQMWGGLPPNRRSELLLARAPLLRSGCPAARPAGRRRGPGRSAHRRRDRRHAREHFADEATFLHRPGRRLRRT